MNVVDFFMHYSIFIYPWRPFSTAPLSLVCPLSGIFFLLSGLIFIGCKGLSSPHDSKTYYTYDAKYGGYPTGRIEK